MRPLRAYGGDCTISGRLDAPEEKRLTDLLNESALLVVSDVTLRSLEDGHGVTVPVLELEMSDVYAVEATGGRGTQQQRLGTRSARIALGVGPYRVVGWVHAPKSADPLAAFTRGRTMVPLTDAQIVFFGAGSEVVRDVEVLIVNRDHIGSLATAEGDVELPRELGMVPVDPRAKDLTGAVYVEPPSDDDLK